MRKRRAAGSSRTLEIEGNSEGDSEERKPILVIPFSSPPFGLWMEEEARKREDGATTVKGIFGIGRGRREEEAFGPHSSSSGLAFLFHHRI